MEKLFYPSSVAIFGISTHPANLGREIARNLFEFGYTGVIHLVGKEGGVLFGRRIHGSVEEIDEPIDLAIILTPARTVPEVLEQCGQQGIKRAVIESGGFGEFGEEGKVLGQSLKLIAHRYGMRFIGPNCIGIMNASNGLTTPFTRLQNVFRPGRLGIIAQSGGVALSFLNMFDSEQLGFSKFSSIGNKIDVDENDLLEFYIRDPETSVICMYLESVRDGRRLIEIGRNSPKPILCHKANLSPMSKMIAASHTDALVNDDYVVDAAFEQSGIMRFRDSRSYVDFAKILQLPRMEGRNLGIVSRSGGHAVVASDAAFKYKFNLPPFNEEFLEMIRQRLRAKVIRLSNPLDLGDLFDFDVYVQIIEHTLKQPEIDGILMIQTYFASVEGKSSRMLFNSAASLSRKYNKPVVLCVYTEQHEISSLFKEFDFPLFLDPERALSALDASIDYNRRKEFNFADKPLYNPKPYPQTDAIGEIINQCISDNSNPTLFNCLEILKYLGIPIPGFELVKEAANIKNVYSKLEKPLALKVVASEISHKTESGGVILNISSPDALVETFIELDTKFKKDSGIGLKGFLVQEMAKTYDSTVELIVGAKRDSQFGPVVILGHGGIFAEIIGKTTARLPPLPLEEIDSMIDSLPGSEILTGARNRPAVNRESIRDVIGRIAWLMENFEAIDQIDLNPVWVSAKGSLAVDARIFLRH